MSTIQEQLDAANRRIAELEAVVSAAQAVGAEGWGWCSEFQHFERMAKMDRLRAALAAAPESAPAKETE